MFRNRMFGGVSFLPFYAPEGAAGAGGASGAGGAGGAGAGAGDGVRAGEGAAAGAAAGSPGGGAVAGVSDAAGGAAGGAGASGAGVTGGAAAAGTLAGGGEGAAAAALAAPPKFPDNWRELLAGDDKQALKDLQRFTEPGLLAKSWRELRQERDSGKVKPVATLPANATPEQLAEYRTANGLPDKVETYIEKLALPDGVVVGEADKALVAGFAKEMFEAGGTQAEMNRAVSYFYKLQGEAEAQRADADGQLRVESEVALKGEWGGDFRPNMNAFGALKAQMPEELQVAMFTARTSDGRLLGNTPELIKWGAQLGRELNPAAAIVPAGSGDAGKTIAAEIAGIEAKMYLPGGTANPEYWKGAGGEALQARYRELTAAQQKMAARGKAA